MNAAAGQGPDALGQMAETPVEDQADTGRGLRQAARRLLHHRLGWNHVRRAWRWLLAQWPLLGLAACGTFLALELADLFKAPPSNSETHVAGDLPGFLHCRYICQEEAEPLRYHLYLPPHFAGQAGPFPLIIFLAGYGERHGDLRVGLAPYIRKHVERGGRFEFAAYLPAGIALNEPVRTMEVLDHVVKKHNIDPDRIYLTGHSKGGAQTWQLASLYPDRWAAIAPLCNASAGDIKPLRRIPCWVFQGAEDGVPTAEVARALVKRLRDQGGEVRYTEYPGESHLIWPKVYFTAELYQWFAANKRR